MRHVALDEQRHIGFGVKLLHDLAQEDPECRDAVADLLRAVTPYSLAVFVPPDWDRSYTECFGFTLEEIYDRGRALVRGQAARRRAADRVAARAAGLPDGPRRARARRARPGDAARRLPRPGNGAPPRDPAAMAMLFDRMRRAVDHRTAPAGPFTVQWEFADAEPWHVRVDNGVHGRGRRPRAARRPRGPLPLRGLGRHRRRPARPAPRARHPPAAPARLTARAVAPPARCSNARPTRGGTSARPAARTRRSARSTTRRLHTGCPPACREQVPHRVDVIVNGFTSANASQRRGHDLHRHERRRDEREREDQR